MKRLVLMICLTFIAATHAQEDSLRGAPIPEKMVRDFKIFRDSRQTQFDEELENKQKEAEGKVSPEYLMKETAPLVDPSIQLFIMAPIAPALEFAEKRIIAAEAEALIITPAEEEELVKRRVFDTPSQYDSRIEIAQLLPTTQWHVNIRKTCESVAMVVDRQNITLISPGKYQLTNTMTLKDRHRLCDGEAFANQLIGGTGTAFVIGENTMVTAAHVFNRPLKHYAIVFGYRVLNALGTAETGFNIQDVFFPTEIVAIRHDLDLVSFKVDKPLEREALIWEKSATLKKRTEIYMVGHPMGLPQKVALNASITNGDPASCFYTSLDAYQGNSGSPVFNFETNKVIGVLVSGMTDFEQRGDCYKSTICREGDCSGEKAVRIEQFLETP